MKIPFQYGSLAFGDDFTNRREEKQRLINNFSSGVNTIIVSPRRWGKSSLVHKVASEMTQKNNPAFTFIDLSNVKTEEDFYSLYSKSIIKANAQKIDQLAALVKKYLSRFIPKISFSPDDMNEFSLSFDWDEVKKNPMDILNLSEKIASSGKKHQVICIDEFQNISSFTDAEYFQKVLRANWQQHQFTSYCLYGSKRHMMMEVFTSSSKPFYQFGDILFLEKIHQDHWQPFIQQAFRRTKKKINKNNSLLIARKTECHPYYTQQLAQQCWLRTVDECTEDIIEEAHDSLIRQLSLIFQNLTDMLTATQINFLKALLNNEREISSKKNLQKYKLGTSANVVRIKEALLHKDIIDIQLGDIQFIDPLFKSWLNRYYFK
jgi:AAA+ ATPase superfamily predicted ATPase